MPAFGGTLTATPEAGIGFLDTGREYTLGWRTFEFQIWDCDTKTRTAHPSIASASASPRW
ncbi:MAG: hypothetical protein F4Z15_09605 [Gammaproteobacteria bacterium]|nr:hypothetical protein [Gammaproteobacteria bacterium]MYD76109.1 hypothetical protein [Gammaproteobacteria bacterium]MYJ52563.1 hypothetical protein [Gammaproteobacteria bacterium]